MAAVGLADLVAFFALTLSRALLAAISHGRPASDI
jgi:hypothetical protein